MVSTLKSRMYGKCCSSLSATKTQIFHPAHNYFRMISRNVPILISNTSREEHNIQRGKGSYPMFCHFSKAQPTGLANTVTILELQRS